MNLKINISKYLSNRNRTIFLLPFLFLSIAFSDYYDERPDIFKVPPSPIAKTQAWEKSRDGHFVLLAQLLTFFPDADFYFLARDIEYLYDISKVLFKNNPEMLKRLHIVPVSTSLSYEIANTRKYLQQEGVTKANLGNRTALFVDSCCSGSVPDRIKTAFNGSGLNVKGFLIQANAYPSSSLAGALGTSGIGIEGLPHHTQSASSYENKNGKIRVVANPGNGDMQKNSKQIMQDIRHQYDNAESRQRLADMTAQMRIVFSFVSKDSIYKPVSIDEAVAALKKLITEHGLPMDPLLNDMGATARKQYRKIDTQRMGDLKSAYTSLVGTDLQFFVKKVAKGEHSVATIAQMLSNNKETIVKVLRDVTKALLTDGPKAMGVTKAVLEKNTKSWAGQIAAHTAALYFNDAEGIKLVGELQFKVNNLSNLRIIVGTLVNHADSKEKTEELRKILVKLVAAEGSHFNSSNSLIRTIVTSPQFFQNHELTENIIRDYLLSAPKTQVQAVLSHLVSTFVPAIGWGNPHSKKHFELLERLMKSTFEARPEFVKPVVELVLKTHFFNNHTIGSQAAQRYVKFVLSQSADLTEAQKKSPVSNAFVAWLFNDKSIYSQSAQITVSQLLQKISIANGVPVCKQVYL